MPMQDCRHVLTFKSNSWFRIILDDITNTALIEKIRGEVVALCKRFPVYAKGGVVAGATAFAMQGGLGVMGPGTL